MDEMPDGGVPEDEDGFPRLSEIPRGRWSEVLRGYSHYARRRAAYRAGDDWKEAFALVSEMEVTEPLPEIATPSLPSGPKVDRFGRRQVNLKLEDAQHARLAQAAATVGLRPTQLARLLVMRGVDAMLSGR